jgi:Ulp1 family protease
MAKKSDNCVVASTVEGTELRLKDLRTVIQPTAWLNDEIIAGYLAALVNNRNGTLARGVAPEVHCFTSFFMGDLLNKGPKNTKAGLRRKRIDGPKLLSVKTLLIPVNSGNHWTLVVVSPAARTVSYLDSLGGSGQRYMQLALEWLELETKVPIADWQIVNTSIPAQTNGYDCGVFVCTNAECAVAGVPSASYQSTEMAAQRNRIAGVLINGFSAELPSLYDIRKLREQ